VTGKTPYAKTRQTSPTLPAAFRGRGLADHTSCLGGQPTVQEVILDLRHRFAFGRLAFIGGQGMIIDEEIFLLY
jgi:hypothetical protein